VTSENGQDMDSQDVKDLAAAYALGALDPAEARSFEAFLATSAEARREVAEFREVAALLATTTEGTGPGPSSDLRSRVLARVAQEKVVPLKPVTGGSRWIPWAAAAAALLAVGLGLQTIALRRQVAQRDAALAELQRDFGATQAQLAAREATLNAILEPDVRLTTLTSSSTPAPVIRLFMNPKKVALIHAFNLQPPKVAGYFSSVHPQGRKPIPPVTFNVCQWPRDGARGGDSRNTRPRRRRGDANRPAGRLSRHGCPMGTIGS
jgi:anti-sigma-K factor RskA